MSYATPLMLWQKNVHLQSSTKGSWGEVLDALDPKN